MFVWWRYAPGSYSSNGAGVRQLTDRQSILVGFASLACETTISKNPCRHMWILGGDTGFNVTTVGHQEILVKEHGPINTAVSNDVVCRLERPRVTGNAQGLRSPRRYTLCTRLSERGFGGPLYCPCG